MSKFSVVLLSLLWCILPSHAQSATPIRLATNLQNPRGVAVLPDGRLLVAEAGTGRDNTGKLSIFDDVNHDGDYDDVGERTPIQEQLPSYNILYQFNPGRDEVLGIGDVLLVDDQRIFYTLDDNFETLSIIELNAQFDGVGSFYQNSSTLNSIAYDGQQFYVAESSNNALRMIQPDGNTLPPISFDWLAHQQHPVPAGVAVDPTTGDVLVALFSGQLWNYYDTILSFMPGDAKVVRVDPQTRRVEDEIVGLTTAVDVAVDERGNIFVVEMTTEWAMPTMNTKFDIFDPDAPPDAGGYARFSGRVTMYPVTGLPPMILAEDLDAPTNITYHDKKLYISTGQGTPNRPIWVNGTRQVIVGELYMLSVPD